MKSEEEADPASDTSDSSDSDDDPRAQQRRQGRKLFKPTPASTTRLAGEHISVTLAPGMKQVGLSLFTASVNLTVCSTLTNFSLSLSPVRCKYAMHLPANQSFVSSLFV